VLLIDAHLLFLQALRKLLSSPPLGASVQVATRLIDAPAILRAMPVDLVICDVSAAGLGGADLALLAVGGLKTPVILLADGDETPLLMAAVLSRAVGFFRKDTPVEEFLEGVGTALRGGSAVGRDLLEPALAALSEREKTALTLSARRHSMPSIAATMGISKDAVREALDGAYRKVGLNGRLQAIRWCTKMGLTQPELAIRD